MTAPSAVNMFQPHPTGGPGRAVSVCAHTHTYTHTHASAKMWLFHRLLSVQHQMIQVVVSSVGQNSDLLSEGSFFPSPTAPVHTVHTQKVPQVLGTGFRSFLWSIVLCLDLCWLQAGRRGYMSYLEPLLSGVIFLSQPASTTCPDWLASVTLAPESG